MFPCLVVCTDVENKMLVVSFLIDRLSALSTILRQKLQNLPLHHLDHSDAQGSIFGLKK